MSALSQPIRFAVAGLGRIGVRHARFIRATEGLELAAVCDPSAEARQKFAADPASAGVRVESDYAAMIADPTVAFVVVATPSHLHYDMSIRALEAGRHVLVEKPMAANAEEAAGMVETARRLGLMLTVNQAMRYQSDAILVREVVQSGVLGDIFSIYRSQHAFRVREDWQIWKKYGGGAVANFGTHFIDSLLRLVDSPPQSVFARFGRVLDPGDAEDWFKITVRTASGQILEAEMLRSYFGKAFWHVCGTRGALYIDDTLPVVTMQVKTLDGEDITREIDFRQEADKVQDYYADLARHLLRGDPPPVSADDVLVQMRVIDAARQSDETGESVTLDHAEVANPVGV